MTLRRCLAVFCVANLLGASVQAGTTVPQGDIDRAVSQIQTDSGLISRWISDQLKIAVPFNATSGNVVPKQIKFFGVEIGVEGLATGTTLDNDALRKLGATVVDTTQIDSFNRLPLPALLGHLKVALPGGLDAGLRWGGMPSTHIDKGDTRVNVGNTIWGIDLRKQLIGEGLTRPFGLTLGAHFTRAKGSITSTTPYSSNLGTSVVGTNSYSTTLSATGAGRADWDAKSVGVQAILNKQLALFNPYVGASASKNFGSVQTSISTAGTIALTDVANAANAASQVFSTAGSGSATPNEWDLRLLAGLEIGILPFVRLGLGLEYAGSRKLGASLGMRAQFP